jgi:2-polyprenyl-3-methyl-5-hydroxy-6-metoxy-1,4-benzoquinol methylase
MDDAKYDQISDFYLNFVHHGLENSNSIFHLAIQSILDLAGDLSGKSVCDLACGEGYLSRILAEQGAAVTGVDLSQKLLDYARQQNSVHQITYINDDAQTLGKLAGQSFDAIICNLALMDIPDLQATFQTVHRQLKKQGCFFFSILHPCFETPFRVPENPIETDEEGNFIAVRVMHYLQEGYWNSGGDGMRGRVGAHHRTLSTYFNTLLDCGFQLARLVEPALPEGDAGNSIQKDSRVPTILVVKAVPE